MGTVQAGAFHADTAGRPAETPIADRFTTALAAVVHSTSGLGHRLSRRVTRILNRVERASCVHRLDGECGECWRDRNW